MASYILNGSPYRTRPGFLQSRMAQSIPAMPGPAYGNFTRIKDNIITSRPRELFPIREKSKLFPSLRGLGQEPTEAEKIIDLAKKVAPVADSVGDYFGRNFKAVSDAVISLYRIYVSKGLIPQGTAMSDIGDTELARVNPDLIRLYQELSVIYPFVRVAGTQARAFASEIPKTGVQERHREFYSKVKPLYDSMVASLSDDQRKQFGLGNPWAIAAAAAIIGIFVYLIVDAAGSRFGTPNPQEQAATYERSKTAIAADPNLSDAQKKSHIDALTAKYVKEFDPRPTGTFWANVGMGLLIVGGAWLVLKSGLLGSIGKGIGMKLSAPRERRSSALFEQVKEKKYERELASLSGRPRSAGKARKRGRPRKVSKFRV